MTLIGLVKVIAWLHAGKLANLVTVANGTVIAQAAGEQINTTSVIASLITTSPVAAVAFFGWWATRADLKAEQKARQEESMAHKVELAAAHAANLAMLERFLPLITESTTTLKDVQEAMSQEVRMAARRRTGVTPEFEETLSELLLRLREAENRGE